MVPFSATPKASSPESWDGRTAGGREREMEGGREREHERSRGVLLLEHA